MNDVLKKYFPVADLIAGTFGKECEVTVHDLENPEESVVHVSNGTVTGRKVGQSFDHLIKNVLMNNAFKDDMMINYNFETVDGRKIRSSTLFIRDEADTVVGALCINYDISRYLYMQESLQSFFGSFNSDGNEGPDKDEMRDQNVSSILDDLISGILGNEDVGNLSRKRCVELVKFMDDKGVFLVKGAVEKVAAAMGVSKVTIYSYLDSAKGKR